MPVFHPVDLDETVHLLSTLASPTILSGGTDLMVEINLHGRRPENIVSLRHVSELRTWDVDLQTSVVRIGSAVPYSEIETSPIRTYVPALAQAARTVGSPQIRAAGTMGGNLGTCSPAGDTLPVLSALDATIVIKSKGGERRVKFQEFMIGVKRNSLSAAEIITSVEIPLTDGWQGYAKVGTRNAMVISTASVCLVRWPTGAIHVALGAVGPTIIRCFETEMWAASQLSGSDRPSTSILEEFGRRVASESRPISDHRSTAEYRRHAVSVVARRLLERSFK